MLPHVWSQLHAEVRPPAILSLPTSCFVCRAGNPCPSPWLRASHGGVHPPTHEPKDLLPETRSTPFCNHTLHFGGLTMKNTKRIRIIGGDGENGTVHREREMEGGERKNAISNGVGVGKTAHPRTVDFSPRLL